MYQTGSTRARGVSLAEERTVETPGDRVAREIVRAGGNASEIARSIGVTPQAISRIASGERPLTVGMAARLGEEFSVRPGYLLTGDGGRTINAETESLIKDAFLRGRASAFHEIQEIAGERQLESILETISASDLRDVAEQLGAESVGADKKRIDRKSASKRRTTTGDALESLEKARADRLRKQAEAAKKDAKNREK